MYAGSAAAFCLSRPAPAYLNVNVQRRLLRRLRSSSPTRRSALSFRPARPSTPLFAIRSRKSSRAADRLPARPRHDISTVPLDFREFPRVSKRHRQHITLYNYWDVVGLRNHNYVIIIWHTRCDWSPTWCPATPWRCTSASHISWKKNWKSAWRSSTSPETRSTCTTTTVPIRFA